MTEHANIRSWTQLENENDRSQSPNTGENTHTSATELATPETEVGSAANEADPTRVQTVAVRRNDALKPILTLELFQDRLDKVVAEQLSEDVVLTSRDLFGIEDSAKPSEGTEDNTCQK